MQVMLYETSNIVEVHTLVGPAGRIATQAVADLSNTTVFALPGRNRGTYGPLSMDGVRFFTN